MKIYTGNFANVKKYVSAGYLPISIAISARYFNGLKYPKLNPRKDFMNDTPETYIPKYNEILKKLNTDEVIKDLHHISEGKDVVLLCHEKAGDFCHRRLVAEWLLNEKGIEVPELGKMEMQKSLF
jgi:uncharacterized protein (DUF488 family)